MAGRQDGFPNNRAVGRTCQCWASSALFPQSYTPLSFLCSVAQKVDLNSQDQKGLISSLLTSPSNPQLTGDWGQQGAQQGTRGREAQKKGEWVAAFILRLYSLLGT